MKKILFGLVLSSCLLFSCRKKVKNDLIGHWQFEYEILEDGSKDYTPPYALLGWTYSDGFLLREDKTGDSYWGGSANDVFNWSNSSKKLFMEVEYSSGKTETFKYELVEISGDEMTIIELKKDHTYRMSKQ